MVFGMVEVGRFKNGCRWQCLDYNEKALNKKEFSLFRRWLYPDDCKKQRGRRGKNLQA
jgi:hypothetical protein